MSALYERITIFTIKELKRKLNLVAPKGHDRYL